MLGDGDPRDNRLRILRRIDESSKRKPELRDDDELDAEEEEKAVVSDFFKLNSAFKTVEIIGQILRNYAGSLKGDQKVDLASDCFGLALRTLSFVYNFIERNLDGFTEFFLERLGAPVCRGTLGRRAADRSETIRFPDNALVGHSNC